MRRRDFLLALTASVLGGCARGRHSDPTASGTQPGAGAAGRKPNIILIVADDLGYADLGCYGGRDVSTPHIDSLAANGARCTNGYVTAPVCSPMRAGLLTGRYQQRFGHEFNPGPAPEGEFGLPLDQVTLPQVLRNAGYATGMVGKWHLGLTPPLHPLRRGFDEYFGFLGGAHSYLDLKKTDANPILRGTTPVDEREYLTDAFAREAVAFIDRHRARPFFLYNPYNAIHTPMQATPKYLDRFGHIKDEKRRTMLAMLAALDDAVGRVLHRLREHGLEDDTLIIFISDNGGPTNANASRNDPLSGYKGELWEGGIRVPYIIQWRSRVPGGTVVDAPVSSLDIFRTSLAAAGAAPTREAALDGVDLMPLLSGRTRQAPHDALYWRFGEPRAIRRGGYKLLILPDREPMLFDLSEDPGEKKNLAVAQPRRVNELRADLQQWDAQLVPPRWGRPARPRPRRRAQRPTSGPATRPARR